MKAEQELLCLAARTTVDGEAERRLLRVLDRFPDWGVVKSQARAHEVTPLIAPALASAGGVPEACTAWATLSTRATLVRNLSLADELLSILGVLEDGGIDAMPVKGLAVAERYYGSLALRPSADIDVLIHPGDAARARGLLQESGWKRRKAPSFVAAHHPFHDVQYHRPTPSGNACLELHSGLWDPRFYRPLDDLWERATSGSIRGRETRMLSDEDALLHLAIHRSRSPLRLRFLCDVAEVVRTRGTLLDWDTLVARAARARARTALFAGLALSRDLLGAPVPAEALHRLGIGRSKWKLLQRTCGAEALFRETAQGDPDQQPSLSLRVLEQDGAAHMTWALAQTMARKAPKRLYERRRARILASTS